MAHYPEDDGPASTPTSFEVEIKLRLREPEATRMRLDQLGARCLGTDSHEDTYLAHPSRDFAQTGEALRIRRIGDENRVTYKGPKQAGPVKTREEIEIAFEAGRAAVEQLRRLWELLGFCEVAVVRKSRSTYALQEAEMAILVAVDETESLGMFLEVEAIASGALEIPRAQDAVRGVAVKLGIDPVAELEPRSYLRMLLESR